MCTADKIGTKSIVEVDHSEKLTIYVIRVPQGEKIKLLKIKTTTTTKPREKLRSRQRKKFIAFKGNSNNSDSIHE